MGWKGVDWIYLNRHIDHWRAVVKTAVPLHPIKERKG